MKKDRWAVVENMQQQQLRVWWYTIAIEESLAVGELGRGKWLVIPPSQTLLLCTLPLTQPKSHLRQDFPDQRTYVYRFCQIMWCQVLDLNYNSNNFQEEWLSLKFIFAAAMDCCWLWFKKLLLGKEMEMLIADLVISLVQFEHHFVDLGLLRWIHADQSRCNFVVYICHCF